MRFFKLIFMMALLATIAACSPPSKFRTYDGPEVTRIWVYKERREMFLMHNDTILKKYDFDLGFAPIGDKKIEGDGKTPEGNYLIDRRNPNSRFHLSIGINYPNAEDRLEAFKLGEKPGGDIFIHGRGPNFKSPEADWTWGCIAVTDREMEEIYAMVPNGTPITILP
ncbi:MAG: L,D-transpeptidase family protein [Pseudomonadota bacterium]